MKTAVVILNWNGLQHLQHYLPRVVATTSGADVIVADNGSTDDSVAWLRESMPAVQLVLLDKNYGFAEGYNRALAQLEGYDTFVLLNSDIEPTEGWLAPLVEQLEQNEDIAVVVPKILDDKCRSKFEYAGASGGFIDVFGYPFCRGRILSAIEEDNGQYDTPRDVMWGSGAAFCCRAEVYRELGGLAKEVNAAYMKALPWLERAMELKPESVDCAEYLKGLCFRLRNEEGVMDKYNKYNALYKKLKGIQ